MTVYTKHAASLKSLQAQLGSDCPQLYFNGQLINILPGGVRFKRENTAGGFSVDTDIQLTCLSADFQTLPTSKQTFRYPGRSGTLFNIVSVTTAPTGLQIRINGDNAGKL